MSLVQHSSSSMIQNDGLESNLHSNIGRQETELLKGYVMKSLLKKNKGFAHTLSLIPTVTKPLYG